MSEINVTFTQNVKLNLNRYKKGAKVNVSIEDCKRLIKNNVIEPVEESLLIEPRPVDLYTLSKEELVKINKSDIVEFLDKEGMEFNPKMTKDELINLITSDENEEPEQVS